MKLTSYDIESLRDLVRMLLKENEDLRLKLHKNGIPCKPKSNIFQNMLLEQRRKDAYDPDQAGRIQPYSVDITLAKKFYSRFWGREDVYAQRGKKGGYFPQCAFRWQNICPVYRREEKYCHQKACPYRKWIRLTPEKIMAHLIGTREDGSDVIGIYPLLPDNTCRFLVFDFDNHVKGSSADDYANQDDNWKIEVDALRAICRQFQIPQLTERSRSGRGAHVWILFTDPIPAMKARQFGSLLLDKGAERINLPSFEYYDRMFPAQDSSENIGNLIALPLQGHILRTYGNSAFVDDNWNAYQDQLAVLFACPRLSPEKLDQFISMALADRTAASVREMQRLRPWNRTNSFNKDDVKGRLHIVLADGIYVDVLNLMPRIQNQIRCLGIIDNPAFYKNIHAGRSNFNQFSTINLENDCNGYIHIPRGQLGILKDRCDQASIPYDIDDQREKGHPIRVAFRGQLRPEQLLAAQGMLAYDNGILNAATATGKTVICCSLIAQRQVNTLILLRSRDLLRQWQERLEEFLEIDEQPPAYYTPTGRKKYRSSPIGTYSAGHDKTTGIIDIAMIGSICDLIDHNERLRSYGMVIMDECHAAASEQARKVLASVNAKYVYGVTATPKRSDSLDKIIFMMLGPVRHSISARERSQQTGIDQLIYPRFTHLVNTMGNELDINKAYELVSTDTERNKMIIQDVTECISDKRTPVILTRMKKHAEYLAEHLRHVADHVLLLYGNNTDRENEIIAKRLYEIPDQQSLILIATGSKIGEGFDYPRLDTLFLASPVRFEGRIMQYVGRISREYPGKKNVIVYDYVDSHIGFFDHQYNQRLRVYHKLCFHVLSPAQMQTNGKINTGAIYSVSDYQDAFERDIVGAESELVIASPYLTPSKVDRFLSIVRLRQEAGIRVVVVTMRPEMIAVSDEDDALLQSDLIEQMKYAGVYIQLTDDASNHYAVFDRKLIWHGGINFLGKEDDWNSLIRTEDPMAAAELMEMSF